MGKFFVCTFLFAPVLQLIVGLLSRRQVHVFGIINLISDIVVVGTVVGDIQLAVAIDEGQVTIAVETADVNGTDGDEVTVVNIVDGGGGVAKHGLGVNIQLTTTYNITACKDSIVDNDTTLLVFTINNGAGIHFVPLFWP